VTDTEASRLTRAPNALAVASSADVIARALASVSGATAHELGAQLWLDESERSRRSAEPDDRTLYWTRLSAMQKARDLDVGDEAIGQFERASRGVDFDFLDDVDRRVIVTGFDPFGLDASIEQSNPSGALALVVHDRVTNIRGLRVQFKSSIVPVRYADFDAGCIEALFGPLLEARAVDLAVTVSMGRDAFDLERFPARRRSVTKPDNDGVAGCVDELDPQIPKLLGSSLVGPEFLEFSLPVRRMLGVRGPYSVRLNNTVQTIERGVLVARELEELTGLTAVSGSGGGYLSNEISYRALFLAKTLGSDIPIGHIHTPRLTGYEPGTVQTIVDQTIKLLDAAID